MNAHQPASLRSFMRTIGLLVILTVAGPASADSETAPASTDPADAAVLTRGRYLVVISHCNNCHTAQYGASAGQVPEAQWLLGNPVGWRGRNGTVYAPNLRRYVEQLSPEGWLIAARNARPRAPMPWWTLRDTSDADLIAMYRYMRSLQPVGEPAPASLPPGQAPKPPYNQLPDLSRAD